MTLTEFRAKWTDVELKERSASQEHFIDLCRMLGHPTPVEADKTGDTFCFEKGVEKLGGADGFADVWKRGFFGWEYKGPKADLDAAYHQLLQYREDLQNPPLLIVCDTDRIVVHTNFTNTIKATHTIPLEDIDKPESLAILRNVFHHPEALRPGTTPERATEDAAGEIGELAERLRERGLPAHEAAHFLMKVIFCLFAEDIDLLPSGLMSRLLQATSDEPAEFEEAMRQLFRAMSTGGRVFVDHIDHFNGGLFDDDATVPLQTDELAVLEQVARLDWSQIEPAVFGTLFERSLDPAKRAQLGTHYTSRADIQDIIEPVLMAPLRAEWEDVRDACQKLDAQAKANRNVRTRRLKKLQSNINGFMDRLASVRVLDPACGSGNFLYVALTALKDLEKEVIRATAQWAAEPPFPKVDPSQLYGIEIDPYAAELAQLTVWIGYLQWMRANGFSSIERPLLKPLDNIREQDAILGVNEEGNVCEPEWPEADVIVGNPPFLGGKRQRTELGDEYVEGLFRLYDGRVPHEADFCCYWFERAHAEITQGQANRAGLLATNSIRQGANRGVLDRIVADGAIFMAWSDRDWVLEGAAVRISMIGFDNGAQKTRTLDGQPVTMINADLTAGYDVTQAQQLSSNSGLSFMADTKGGSFDIPGQLAREMLEAPNPLGRANSDVVRPWVNGLDITRRPRDMWIIDFGLDMPAGEAALYEKPFEYVRQHVLPARQCNRRKAYRERWWIHVEARPAMRTALRGLARYIATPTIAKHRLFAWTPAGVLPDHQLIVFARDDDYFLGVLHSRAHEKWALRIASSLEDRPRYTPTTCFETFPFPQPSDAQRETIAEAAKALHEVRQSALDNDPKLTLTKLYNKRPTWLANLHEDLDAAVLQAYGWPANITDDELLEKLLALNLQRAADEERGIIVAP